jgi:phage-related minor tail protein
MSGDTEIGSISVRVGADISDLNTSLDQASRALQGTSDAMESGLGQLSTSAASVFEGVAGSIAKTATSGRSSFSAMVDAMLSQLSRLAVKTFITGPVESLVGDIFKSFSLDGARASGGPVNSGGAYLVGEQGPEIFQPAQSGRIIPNGGMGGVTVNIYAQDAKSVMQSESQIAAMLARVAARGQRNL